MVGLRAVKSAALAGIIVSLSGCGWFRTDLPVRTGPQSEPHVTYADAGAVAQRMTAGGPAQAPIARFRSICGAGDAAAAERAAMASGAFRPPAVSNPGIHGGRSALFEDGRDAVLISTGPSGYHCSYTDGAQTWTWGPAGQVSVVTARG